MKDYRLLVATFFIIPLFIYIMGSGYSASFNLAEWTKEARLSFVSMWISFQIISIIMLSKI